MRHRGSSPLTGCLRIAYEARVSVDGHISLARCKHQVPSRWVASIEGGGRWALRSGKLAVELNSLPPHGRHAETSGPQWQQVPRGWVTSTSPRPAVRNTFSGAPRFEPAGWKQHELGGSAPHGSRMCRFELTVGWELSASSTTDARHLAPPIVSRCPSITTSSGPKIRTCICLPQSGRAWGQAASP